MSIFSRIFRRNKKSEKEFDPGVKGNASERLLDHGFSYGDIYANEKALTAMFEKEKKFPVGSIIIREKWVRSLTQPEKVIAMVKRGSGFSTPTADWEFFAFDGSNFRLRSRETVGNCATCHAYAESDWAFRSYISALNSH